MVLVLGFLVLFIKDIKWRQGRQKAISFADFEKNLAVITSGFT